MKPKERLAVKLKCHAGVKVLQDWEGCVWIYRVRNIGYMSVRYMSNTYPAEGNQRSFFGKFQHKLFFVHCACVACRVLSWNKQCCDNILFALLFPKQESTRFSVFSCVDRCDG